MMLMASNTMEWKMWKAEHEYACPDLVQIQRTCIDTSLTSPAATTVKQKEGNYSWVVMSIMVLPNDIHLAETKISEWKKYIKLSSPLKDDMLSRRITREFVSLKVFSLPVWQAE